MRVTITQEEMDQVVQAFQRKRLAPTLDLSRAHSLNGHIPEDKATAELNAILERLGIKYGYDHTSAAIKPGAREFNAHPSVEFVTQCMSLAGSILLGWHQGDERCFPFGKLLEAYGFLEQVEVEGEERYQATPRTETLMRNLTPLKELNDAVVQEVPGAGPAANDNEENG